MTTDSAPLAIATAEHASTWRWAALMGLADAFVWADVALLWSQGHAWLAALFAYAAVSLGAITGLYVWAAQGHNPGPVLKGDRAAWFQVVFLPFRVAAWCVTIAARIVRRGPSISEIDEGLYLGVRLYHYESVRLTRLGVSHVVDLCAELPTNVRLGRAPFERYGVPVLDRCAPSPDELAEAVDWVAARRAEGHKVYIHCAFGRGRSAVVAAAVLLRLDRAGTADEAVARLVRARPVVSIKGAQYAALVRYARRLRATTGGPPPAAP